MDVKAVSKWFRRQFFVPRNEGPVVRVVCWHVGASTKRDAPAWEENFAPDQQIDETTVDRLVSDLDCDTQDEANQLDGLQQYKLFSFRLQSGDRPTSSFPFRQANENVEEDPANPQSEPANANGLVAMQMRHNEAIIRNTVNGWRDVISTYQKTCARQADQIEALLAQRIESFQVIEQAESGKAAREAIIAAQTTRDKRIDSFVETLQPLIPAAINYMAGQKLLPEKTTPERMMVLKFMETITPEQFSKMRTVLEPEQFGIVATMASDIQAGIDANLPQLFQRLINGMPETVAQRMQAEVFSTGQVLAIRTMIDSLAKSEAAKAAKAQAEAVATAAAEAAKPETKGKTKGRANGRKST
jgi:hypothetical protein